MFCRGEQMRENKSTLRKKCEKNCVSTKEKSQTEWWQTLRANNKHNMQTA
jgi:hypothetical protein